MSDQTNDLTVAIQQVSLRVVDEINMMLDEASPAIKQRLLTNMFSRMATLLLKDDHSSQEDLRAQMAAMFGAMKQNIGDDDDEEQS